MFRIQGELNGKSYDKVPFEKDPKSGVLRGGQPVPNRELVNRFGLPFPEVGKPLVFEVNPKLIKTDRFHGHELVPTSRGLNTRLSVSTGEDAFELFYDNGGAQKSRVRFQTRKKKVPVGVEKAELATFLLLHPDCESSPLRRPNSPWYYRLYDAEASARKQYDHQTMIAGVTQAIFTLPWASIQIRAKGINIKGENLSAALGGGEMATRSRLIVLLNQYPTQFLQQWESEQTELEGILQDAIDRGYIDQKAVSGTLHWVWRSDLNAGNKVCKILSTEEPFRQLVAAAHNHYDQIVGTIRRQRDTDMNVQAASTKTLKQAVAPEVKNVEDEEEGEKIDLAVLTTPELVAMAVQYGTLAFDEGTKEVFKIKKGQRDRVYMTLVDEAADDSWQGIFAEEILEELNIIKSLKTSLNFLLTGKIGAGNQV
jgi:hypothetical protein